MINEGISSPVLSVLQYFVALAVVVLLAYLVLNKGLGSFLKRQRANGRIKIKERLALSQKQALVVVEIDGREMLLGTSDLGIQLISRLTKDE